MPLRARAPSPRGRATRAPRRARDQLLATALAERPRLYPAVLTLTHAGLRIGELAGLEWDDVDLDPARRALTVRRTFSKRKLKPTTKSGEPRRVPLTPHLRDVLAQLRLDRRKEALRRGWGEVPAWVFTSTAGQRLDVRTFEHDFKRLLATANLPPHHSPHSCRHTFATLLLRAGVPAEYVKRRLGHQSLALTTDLYGRWLPDEDEPGWMPKPGQFWIDVLDSPAASGSRMVANAANSAECHEAQITGSSSS